MLLRESDGDFIIYKFSDGCSADKIPKDYYIYFYRLNNKVVYVGKGKGRRAWTWCRKPKEVLESRQDLYIEIYKDGIIHENEALQLECNIVLSFKTKENSLWNKSPNQSRLKISYDYISKYVYYDDSSPTMLRWIENSPSNSKGAIVRKKDFPAGSISGDYNKIGIEKKVYSIHRIVWCLVNETDLPSDMVVNHKDSNKKNNLISNLELVTPAENNRKSKRVFVSYRKNIKRTDNSSGFPGVKFSKLHNKFITDIQVDGKRILQGFSIKRAFGNTVEEKFNHAKECAILFRKLLEKAYLF